ncbi:MAG TPA: oxygenase MpaB family protein [Candidatus Limnocylindria bacterium]|nr:oxygenase MpaB family protein [Candidatus Limnocylindria bacterium]
MWRINREAVLLGAGPAALLLQVAHPMIAEGVAHHSSFEQDPWKRLHGTIRTTMDLVFGDGASANRAVKRLNSVHAGVRGEVHDEEARRVAGAYRAMDPALLLWVQATLIVTSIAAYQRWVGPLSLDELEQFWQEARAVGVRLGIPLTLSPADWPALEAYWARMLADDGPIHVTPTARRLARLIVRPPFPFVPGPLVDLAALPGMALLPPRIRSEFDITWGAPKSLLADFLSTSVRAWTRVVPRTLRSMPHAVAADRRVRRATISGHL